LVKISKVIAATHFPLREEFGFIWLWWGEGPESYPELPYFNVLKAGWQYATVVTE
jgi:phenylpropionate dioxygenase-like ring-hydroxylating dioxygenase large terminal subunit